MSAPPMARPDPATPEPRGAGRQSATPAQLTWLEGELRRWRDDGLVDEPTAAAIRGRYVAHRRVTLARIVLTLGAAFVGLGLIWLVAANLDTLPPLLRFGCVAAIWLGLLVLAEVLARRHEQERGVPSPVVGAARLLAVGAFGAVIFQAAQSLQVPAYEPLLVGLWAVGALLYGYAVLGIGPVVLGVALGTGWLVWQVLESADDVVGVTASLAGAALAAVSLGVQHHRLGRAGSAWRPLGVPWRELGALVALGALFGAALPFADEVRLDTAGVLVPLAVAAVLAALAAVRGDRLDRLEVALCAATMIATFVLAVWRPESDPGTASDIGAADWVRAIVAVAAFLALASGYAMLGGIRDSSRLTWLATAALVVFVTTQASAVFAPILSGAVLFLVVGVVLLGSGVLADRGRRRLAAQGREVT